MKTFFYFFYTGYRPCLEINNTRPAIGKNINPVGSPAEREISLANFQSQASLYFRNNLRHIAAQCSFVLTIHLARRWNLAHQKPMISGSLRKAGISLRQGR